MGTRANIGIQYEDGSVRCIYTHWDGYPSHHGPILAEVYNTPEKIEELLDLGDLSSLGRKIGVKHDFQDNDFSVCTAYNRDREQTNFEAQTLNPDQIYPDDVGMNDYAYLFKDGAWYVKSFNTEWDHLSDVMDQLQLGDESYT